MKDKILEYLSELEKVEDINILYACESGSRMWGIEFEDSDYDVRFIYHRPLTYYLTIIKQPDVIDINNCKNKDIIRRAKDDNIDIVGFDLNKYLFLFYNSNSTMFEWLNSPITYKKDIYFMWNVGNLVKYYFNFRSIYMSYLGLAKSNTKKYLTGELVYIKKYLYSIRPLYICCWMLNNQSEKRVPVNFNILSQDLPSEVRNIVNKIMKDRSSEKNRSLRLRKLDDYIEKTIAYLENQLHKIVIPYYMVGQESLDRIFYKIVVGDY